MKEFTKDELKEIGEKLLKGEPFVQIDKYYLEILKFSRIKDNKVEADVYKSQLPDEEQSPMGPDYVADILNFCEQMSFVRDLDYTVVYRGKVGKRNLRLKLTIGIELKDESINMFEGENID